MISKLSRQIAGVLLKRNVIQSDEKDLYDYGLFILISYITFFLVSLLFGIALNIPFVSMIFFISFCSVRNFAGGIHANTEVKCDILTTISILISEILIKVFIDYHLIWVAFAMLILSSISLIAIKPVASLQKEISRQEQLYFHKKVIVLTVVTFIVAVICIIFEVYSIMVSLSMGLFLASILLVLGKMQQLFKNIFSKQKV